MLLKKKSFFFLLILLFLCISAFAYRKLLLYGYQQAKGMWHIIQYAEPFAHYLQDTNYSEKLQHKIQLVQAIKAFAKDSLDLHTQNTYQSLYLQEKKMWVLTASEPYALQAYTWSFPFIGSFPYKGFFDSTAAHQEEQQLLDQGYDTSLRTTHGWSTLGWIENPLHKSMLQRTTGQLVDLILHELMHNTLYIKNNAALNENIATFVAYHGTKAFLDHTQQTKETQAYLSHQEDYHQYASHFLRGAQQLDSLYLRFHTLPPQDIHTRKTQKKKMILHILQTLDTIRFHHPKWKQRYKNTLHLPNNARFMSYLRYRDRLDSLTHDWKKQNHSLRAYIQYLRKTHAHHAL